jgi:hypothetical protein
MIFSIQKLRFNTEVFISEIILSFCFCLVLILRALFHPPKFKNMSEFISVNDASKMNADFRTIRELMLQTTYQGNNTLPICETFDKEQVLEMLGQTDCVALRVYLGLNDDTRVVAVLVGVNDEDEDILGNEYVLERGTRCPLECPPSSALNS